MKSFIVIGMGRFGSALACELTELGNEVLAIDENEDAITRVADSVTHAVVGDAKDENVLRSIGARNFDCAVVAIAGDIQDSVLVTLMLKEMGVKTVIAKAQSALHMRVLERIGADRVVFPERDMGQRVAQNLAASNIIDFIELSDDYSIMEISCPERWFGKTLKDTNVRGLYGINVIAVRGGDDAHKVTVSPPANYEFQSGDVLVVIGGNFDLERLREL